MKRQFKLSLIIISILIISVFSTSCGLGTIFLVLNDIAFDLMESTNEDSSTDETDESNNTETTTNEATTAEATTEPPTSANTENINVNDTPNPTNTTDTPTGVVITEPETYTAAESVTAASIVASLNPTNAYSAVRTFHDWIVNNTTYYYGADINFYNNAAGVFTYNTSVCLGYSLAFEALIEEWGKLHPEAGIECKVAYGDDDPSTPYIRHAWNLVKLNGAWYNLDVTWNDTTESFDFFLLSDATIQQTREVYWVDNYETPPACTSTAYEFGQKDYGITKTVALNNLSEFSNAYILAIQEGYTSVTFFYSSSESLSSLSFSNGVWAALRAADKNYISYYQHNYQDNYGNYYLLKYDNGSYIDYNFFTVVATKR